MKKKIGGREDVKGRVGMTHARGGVAVHKVGMEEIKTGKKENETGDRGEFARRHEKRCAEEGRSDFEFGTPRVISCET